MITFYKTFWLGEWRWRIKATNGKIIASSSKGYKNKKDAEANLYSVYRELKYYYTGE